MSDYIISLDVGTQGTKAALFDQSMNLIDTAFEVSELFSPAPGVIWQEPEAMYLSCARTIRALLEKTGVSGNRIAAIGVDGQMAGIMGVGEDGEATTKYDSWLDMRCGPYMDEMNARAGERIIQLSGGPATYVHGPKILWLKNQEPERYKKTRKFVLPGGYIVGKMCGLKGEEAFFDYTHLHFSCLSDNEHKRWSGELLDTFEIDKAKMARIVSPFEVVGRVQAAFARLSGVSEGVQVVAGCGDTAASTFGSGLFEKGMILDCAGTASVLSSVVDKFVPDVKNRTLTMMRSPVDGLYLPLAYIGGGGLCVRWMRDELTGTPHATYEQLQAEAELIPAGSEGLIFIPHFAGRVLPSNPHLKGAFLGLDFKHTRAHLYRAVLESIAYEYSDYLGILRSLYPDEHFTDMLSIGGGASSGLFNQIKADVLGLALTTFETGETALIGSAVIAGVGCGLLSDYQGPIRQALRAGSRFAPDAARHEGYKPYAASYLAAMDSLTGFYKNAPIYQ